MQYKKLTDKYPVLPCPDTDIPPTTSTMHCSNYPGAKPYEVTIRNILYTAISDDELLIITAYYDGGMLWRTYLTHDDYVVQKPDGKRSTCGIDGLVRYGDGLYAIDCADEIILHHFAKCRWYPPVHNYYSSIGNSPGIRRCVELQDEQHKRKLDAKHDKIRRSIDNDMLCIRPEPKGFGEWLRKDVCNHYILYRTGSKEGVCTRCGKTTAFEGKHNEIVRCKHCHTDAVLKCEGRYKAYSCFDNFDKAYLMQRTSRGIVTRLYDVRLAVIGKTSHHYVSADGVTRTPLTDKFDIVFAVSEVGRYFLSADLTTIDVSRCYEMSTPSNMEYNWYRRYDMSSWRRQIYPGNIESVVKDVPGLKYMPLRKIISGSDYVPHRLLNLLIKYPWLEYTAKMGLDKLTACMLGSTDWELRDAVKGINPDGKNILQILGITRADIEPLKKMHATMDDLMLYKAAKKQHATAEEIKKLFDLCGKKHSEYNKQYVVEILRYSTAAALLKYLPEQEAIYNQRGYDNALSDYLDYLNDAAQAGYNMDDSAIIRPHDLLEAHNAADADIKAQAYYEDELQYADAIEVRASEYDELNYSDGDYIIKVIGSLAELCNETRMLNHCVGSYAGWIANGSTIICSVRAADKPDTPLTTIELTTDYSRIVQQRAYKNSTPPDDIIEFVKRWHAKIKSKSRKAG